MSKRGTFYRCHLFFIFDGPQTTGVTAQWTQNLEALGSRETLSGDLVEMYVIINNDAHQLDATTRVRIDILEEDHLLTGGLDDRIVSYLGTNAPEPEEGFEREEKTTHFQELGADQTFLSAVQAFQDAHLPNLHEHILILKELEERATYHVLAWWTTKRLEDYLNSEYYFIINVNDAFEDQATEILDVSPTSLEQMFDEHRLHKRHMENVLFRRRLEFLRSEDVQRFLENTTVSAHQRYLLRLLDFVRDQAVLQATPIGEREKITFVMGREGDHARNQFYNSARQYFDLNQAGILEDSLRTLEAVRDHLENNSPSNGRPWGEINIVVHANEEGGMSIPVFPGGRDVEPHTLSPAVDTPLLFVVDISNSRKFIGQLQDTEKPVSRYLQEQLSDELQQRIATYSGPDKPGERLLLDVIDRFNWVMQRRTLYSPQRFADIELPQEIQRLIEQNPQGPALTRLNRLLLEQVYGNSIKPYSQDIEREFEPLSDNLVDARTTIRIRGCALGRNQDILRLLSVAFGGSEMQRPIVRAPKHLQVYEFVTRGQRVTEADESFTEFWFVGFPHGQQPANDVLITQFDEKYPDVDVDWVQELPRAVTPTRTYELTYTYEYRRIPQNARALVRVVHASIENSRTWRKIRETSRIPNNDGSITIHFEARSGNQTITGEIPPVGPNPPRNNEERLALLHKNFEAELVNQYTWRFRPNDRSIGNGQRAYRLVANGQRTILRIQRPLQARLQPLFDLASGAEEELENHTIIDELRQAFENAEAPLSEEAIVSVRVGSRAWLLVDPEVKRTYVIRLQNDQLNVFVERPLDSNLDWQDSLAHPPATDLTHFGEEVPVRKPQRPLGQNVLPE